MFGHRPLTKQKQERNMAKKTIKTTMAIQLDKKYILPIHQISGYVAWQLMSKLQRKKLGRAYVRFHGIKTTKELAQGAHSFTGLLNILVKDGTIDYVFERKRKEQIMLGGELITIFYKNDGKIDWRRMKRTRSVRYINAYCREYNIKNAFELAHGTHNDPGMYQQILKAGWTDDVFPPPPPQEKLLNGNIHLLPRSHNGNVNWDKVSNAKFRRYFRDVCVQNGVKQRTDMRDNAQLLQVAKKRGLLDELLPLTTTEKDWHGKSFRFPTKGKRIMWSELSDAEAEATAEAYFLEHNIHSSDDLIRGQFQNKGLYKDLNQRGLLPKLFGHTDMLFEVLAGELFVFRRQSDGKRSWHEFDDQAVERYTHAYLKEHGIATQNGLKVTNNSLLQLLTRRGILKKIFPATEAIVEYCGRRFRLPMQGRYILWRKMDPDILNIYVAARIRSESICLKNLPDSLIRRIDRQKVRTYRQRLPLLDSDTARRLRERYDAPNNNSLPDEILWAYGFEKLEDKRIRTKYVRKIYQPEP